MRDAIDIHRGHLLLKFLYVVEIFLRDVVHNAVEGTLQFAIQGLEQQVETVEAELVSTGQNQHLSVNFVVQFVAVGTVVASVAVRGILNLSVTLFHHCFIILFHCL